MSVVNFDVPPDAADDDAEPPTFLGAAGRDRSRVDVELPFRERVLDAFFLFESGDRATVALLMRGMPLPATFGFPGTDGGVLSNFVGFVKNFHPCISIFTVHPLCPFSARERFVVFVCSVLCGNQPLGRPASNCILKAS